MAVTSTSPTVVANPNLSVTKPIVVPGQPVPPKNMQVPAPLASKPKGVFK